MRIIYAEDDFLSRKLIASLVKKDGHVIDTVDNGKQLLDRLHEDHNYDVAFVDIQMPLMNGFEAIEAIRTNGEYIRNMKILVISAYTDDDNIQKIKTSGANDYLSKPVLFKELRRKLEKLSNDNSQSNSS